MDYDPIKIFINLEILGEENKDKYTHTHFYFFSRNTHTHTNIYMWGQGTYDLANALLGPRARAEEGICRGRIGKGRNVGSTVEDDPVIGIPRLQREEQHLVEGCP